MSPWDADEAYEAGLIIVLKTLRGGEMLDAVKTFATRAGHP
jgi:hypothetical protein